MTSALRVGIAMVALLVFAAPASASTRLAVPSGGSTTDADCTITTCEVHHAVAVATPGDTVQLAAGTYDASTRINVDKPITLAGDPAGARPVVTIANDTPILLSPGVTLRYLTVQATTTGWAISGLSLSGLTLDRVLAQAPYGTDISGGATIVNSVLKATDAFRPALNVDEPRDDSGGTMPPPPDAVTVAGSTLIGATALQMEAMCQPQGGNMLYIDSNVRMRNTVLRGTNSDIAFLDGIDCPDQYGAHLDIDYSNYRPSTVSGGSDGLTTLTAGSHNQTDGADLNVVPTDGGYRENASSPTVDAGNDSEVQGTADYFGHARIAGTHVDIGASEYIAGPGAFELSTPADSASLPSATPTLVWGASTGADHYDLFVDGILDRSGLSGTSATPSASLADGSHTWKVVAYNTAGGQTDSTSTRTFTVDTTPPGAFALSSPANSALVATGSPTLSWAAASGADHYDLSIDGSADRTGVTGTSTTPTAALTDGTHTWSVTAVDAAGNSTAASTTRSITVDTTPPGAFGLSAPADNFLTANASPALSWAAASGADHYDLTIDGTTNRTGVTGTSTTPTSALADGAHTWTVVAVDAAGNTTGAATTRTITVDTTPPGVFDLGAPAERARVTTASPTLSWAAAPGADHYDLTIDGTANRSGVTGTSTTPTTALGDGAHTWTVVAIDAAGNQTAAASTRTFTVDTAAPAPSGPAPGEPTNPAPSPGGGNVSAASFSILSRHAAHSGAVTYRLKVSGAGALTASATPVGKSWTAGRGKAKATRAGTVALVLKPTSRAKRSRSLKVTVTVTFKPASGKTVTKTAHLTLRFPARRS